jgi:hypothetical protein
MIAPIAVSLFAIVCGLSCLRFMTTALFVRGATPNQDFATEWLTMLVSDLRLKTSAQAPHMLDVRTLITPGAFPYRAE